MTETSTQLLTQPWIRQAFPVLNEVTYLNTGTYGIMPGPALEEYLAYAGEFERRGVASSHQFARKAEETRIRLAAMLNATPEELSFTRNATDGINLVLAGIDWQPGDEVITTVQEHEAVMHPLLILHQTKGLLIRLVEVSPDAAEMLARLEALRTPRTRLLALSLVTCETGTRLPGAEISAWGREKGILTLLDGAQASGDIPVDLKALGCDFYASNGHKWMSGPKGCGFFFCRAESRDAIHPAHVGAGSLQTADISAMTAALFPDGRRFEFGTRAWPIYAGLGASLDWIERIGWQNVYAHIAGLSLCLKNQILARPWLTLLSPLSFTQSSGLVTFSIRDHSASELRAVLHDQHRIYVRVIPHYNAMRISTALFLQPPDIDRLLEALRTICGF